MMDDLHIDEWAAFASDLARESGELILHYYRKPLDVQRKADQSPVTVADRDAEALLRARIEARYPDHQVLGEEAGTSGPPEARFQWVLDPIDGTKAFVRGVPLFGTLIGLLDRGRPVLGVIHLPATGELLIGAEGRATTLNGELVRVSGVDTLRGAAVMLTCPDTIFEMGYGEAFHALRGQAELVRGWGDCYGHFLVATGRAEVMLDPTMNLWDIAALKPCVEGAGGRLTDFSGEGNTLGTSALSTNGALHDPVLRILKASK
jgi:histidinol phosphatase-like enzyme (inositol monophosphatase family)